MRSVGDRFDESPVACRTFQVDRTSKPPLVPAPQPPSPSFSEKRHALHRAHFEEATQNSPGGRARMPRVDWRAALGSTGDSDLGASEMELELENQSPPPEVARRLRIIREVHSESLKH